MFMYFSSKRSFTIWLISFWLIFFLSWYIFMIIPNMYLICREIVTTFFFFNFNMIFWLGFQCACLREDNFYRMPLIFNICKIIMITTNNLWLVHVYSKLLYEFIYRMWVIPIIFQQNQYKYLISRRPSPDLLYLRDLPFSLFKKIEHEEPFWLQ